MINGVFPTSYWGSGAPAPPPEVTITDHGYTAGGHAVIVTGIAAHNTIVVTAGTAGGAEGVSVTDTSGNIYTRLVHNSGSESSEIWYCLDPIALDDGNVVTINWTSDGTTRYIHVFSLSTIATVGSSGGGNGVSHTPSATTTDPVDEGSVVFGNMVGGPSGFSPSQSIGWSGAVIGFIGSFPGGNQQACDGYKKVSVTGVQTYGPTVANGIVWAATIGAFGV